MNIEIVAPRHNLPEDIREGVHKAVSAAMDRFGRTVREMRVTLYDENGPRGGMDKRCLVRVRLQPRGVLVVSKRGTDILAVVAEAVDSTKTAVGRRVKRATDRAVNVPAAEILM